FMHPSCDPLSRVLGSVLWKHTLLTVRLWSLKMTSIFDLVVCWRFQTTTAPLVAAVASTKSSAGHQATSLLEKFRLFWLELIRLTISVPNVPLSLERLNTLSRLRPATAS